MTTTLTRDPERSILPANVWSIRIRLPDHWTLSNDCLEELSSPNQDPQRLERPDQLDGENTLPNFTVNCTPIWSMLDQSKPED